MEILLRQNSSLLLLLAAAVIVVSSLETKVDCLRFLGPIAVTMIQLLRSRETMCVELTHHVFEILEEAKKTTGLIPYEHQLSRMDALALNRRLQLADGPIRPAYELLPE